MHKEGQMVRRICWTTLSVAAVLWYTHTHTHTASTVSVHGSKAEAVKSEELLKYKQVAAAVWQSSTVSISRRHQ